VTIDGLRFFLEEAVVLRKEAHIKLRVVNVRDDQTATYTNSRFEFGLLNNEGMQTRSRTVRRVQGAVAVSGDGSLVPPSPGAEGWIVVEFARDSESGAFGIVINHAIAFNKPAEHIVSFRRF